MILFGLAALGALIKFWFIWLPVLGGWLILRALLKYADKPFSPPPAPPAPIHPTPKPEPEPDDTVPAPDIPLRFLAPDIAQEISHRTKMMKDADS